MYFNIPGNLISDDLKFTFCNVTYDIQLNTLTKWLRTVLNEAFQWANNLLLINDVLRH